MFWLFIGLFFAFLGAWHDDKMKKIEEKETQEFIDRTTNKKNN